MSVAWKNTIQKSSSAKSLRWEVWVQLSRRDRQSYIPFTFQGVDYAGRIHDKHQREFVVDSGASMKMVSKRDVHSAELEPVRTSRNPTMVMTANGEVQTREEATENVKELDLFVTVMLLEETPAVLSLGKLCEVMGILTTGPAVKKPHLTKNGKRIHCEISNDVQFVVPGLSTSSAAGAFRSQWKVERSVSRFRHSNACRELLGIDGEPIEFAWNSLPGFTSLQILQKIQEHLNVCQTRPEKFEDRIIFLSIFNDIDWTRKQILNNVFRGNGQELRKKVPVWKLVIPRTRRRKMAWNAHLQTWKTVEHACGCHGGQFQRKCTSNFPRNCGMRSIEESCTSKLEVCYDSPRLGMFDHSHQPSIYGAVAQLIPGQTHVFMEKICGEGERPVVSKIGTARSGFCGTDTEEEWTSSGKTPAYLSWKAWKICQARSNSRKLVNLRDSWGESP